MGGCLSLHKVQFPLDYRDVIVHPNVEQACIKCKLKPVSSYDVGYNLQSQSTEEIKGAQYLRLVCII